MNGQFDLNEALEQIKASARIDGKDGVLAPLIKQLTEAALEAELESHLSTEIRSRKNGKSSKTMKSSIGEFDLDIPRDRNGSFEPQLVKKHQTHISDHIEQKILSFSLYTHLAIVTVKYLNTLKNCMVYPSLKPLLVP